MKRKALAVLLTATTLCMAVGFTGCKSEQEKNELYENGIEQVVNNPTATVVPSKSNGIALMSSVIPTNEYATYGVSAQAEVAYTLMATVNPSTAANKQVDWTVTWLEPNSTFATGKAVTDYVTVVPMSDGSTTATVTCYQPFEGEILVTVTTREGGFQADCIVTFTGVPTSISVSSSTLTPTSGTYGLGVGVTYDFDINLDNVFGVVGEKYHDYSIGFQATGTLTVGTLEDDPRASAGVWYDTRTAQLSEFADQIISYSIEGDVLHVTFNKSVEGFYSRMVRNGSVKTYYDRVKSVDAPCSFLLQISTKELGITFNTRVTFVIDSSVVTGVSVTPTLEF